MCVVIARAWPDLGRNIVSNQSVVSKLLTVEELSAIVRLSPGTIKNLLSKNPQSLPPRRIACGTRAVLFFSEDVDRWMRGLPVLQGVGYKLDKNSKVVEKLIPVVAPEESAQKAINAANKPTTCGRSTEAMKLERQKDAEPGKGRAE